MTASSRRTFTLASAAWIALPAVSFGATLRPTPAQTEGPFYPVKLPDDIDADLLQLRGRTRYAQGDAAWVEGRVVDVDGRALRDAVVEIWQCDHAGRYHHPGDGDRADPAFQGYGRVAVDGDGAWRFRTLKPVPYTGRTPHIHLKVRRNQRALLTTQLYVEGDPNNAADGLWRRLAEADRAAVTRPYTAGPDGLRATYTIVIAA